MGWIDPAVMSSLRLTLLTTAAALAVVPAAAQAATLSAEGDALVLRADEQSSIYVRDSYPEGQVRFEGAALSSVPASCELLDDTTADCAIPGRIRVELGPGSDSFGFGDGYTLDLPIEVYGNGGDDTLHGDADRAHREVLDGGEGKDRIDGYGGDDEIRGGAGDDDLEGNGGADTVLGGDGNDKLAGDDQAAPGADVIDGGAGSDLLADYVEYGTDVHPAADVSLDGAANDGRAGEGDNVTGIERMIAYVSGRFVLSDGAEDWQVWSNMNSGASEVEARGGDDRVVGEDAAETIDGGTGDDYLEGGKGHDTLTGGPGKDTIYGDDTDASCNADYVESCVLYGNDTIQVRDGEADQVDCGAGTDKVVADGADVVSPNCETVERGAAPGPNGPAAGGGKLAPAGKQRLATVLRKGLRLKVTGGKPGKARFRARRGGKTVATGTVTVAGDGSGAVRLKFTKVATRKLKRAKKVTLVVTGAGLKATLTIRR